MPKAKITNAQEPMKEPAKETVTLVLNQNAIIKGEFCPKGTPIEISPAEAEYLRTTTQYFD
jgi:hypothetical protein